MIHISKTAAEQMLKSLKDDTMVLRIAVQQKPDGEFHYIMGVDEPKSDDTRYISNDVKIVVSSEHTALLDNMEIDYVEISPNEYHFIFKNPSKKLFSFQTVQSYTEVGICLIYFFKFLDE